ncbi:DNA methyltransferase [Methylorubrum populi]|nr:DNA methyltransferase [Methylorubrum populi]
MRTIGLFSGSGSLEAGLEAGGHECLMLCEVSEPARRVLASRFPGVPVAHDVADLARLPSCDLLAAGFPCQDLSLSGGKAGFDGARSGLVREIFRLIDANPVPNVLLENVPNLVRLNGGRWAGALADAFEERGYRWAYRIVDARCALPQRRERFFMLASRVLDPSEVLFGDEVPPPSAPFEIGRDPVGFYWTRGASGLGWAPHCTPPIQGGSAKGIPSGPAVLLPDGRVVKIGLRDAERLQGMRVGGTEAAGGEAARWRIVGNAVAEPVAEWIGRRLACHARPEGLSTRPFGGAETAWPQAASGGPGGGRMRVAAGPLPFWRPRGGLETYLRDAEPLSARATRGFLARAARGRMNFVPGFIEAVRSHLEAVERAAGGWDLFDAAA